MRDKVIKYKLKNKVIQKMTHFNKDSVKVLLMSINFIIIKKKLFDC